MCLVIGVTAVGITMQSPPNQVDQTLQPSRLPDLTPEMYVGRMYNVI